MNVKVLTFWRFLYVFVLITWTIALSANELSNRTEWNNVFTNTTTAADNWVHVGSAMGLACGIIVFIMAFFIGCGYNVGSGSMINNSPKLGRLQRIIFDLACSLASLCIVSVSSIYLYVNRKTNKNDEIAGMSWAVVLGGVFLAICVLDALMFKPTMAFMEFMSSICVSRAASRNRVHELTKEIEKGTHFMHRYLQGIVPLMPYLGDLGDKDMCFKGMPVTSIIIGPDRNQKLSDKQWYNDAATDLVRYLEEKYTIQDSVPIARKVPDEFSSFA